VDRYLVACSLDHWQSARSRSRNVTRVSRLVKRRYVAQSQQRHSDFAQTGDISAPLLLQSLWIALQASGSPDPGFRESPIPMRDFAHATARPDAGQAWRLRRSTTTIRGDSHRPCGRPGPICHKGRKAHEGHEEGRFFFVTFVGFVIFVINGTERGGTGVWPFGRPVEPDSRFGHFRPVVQASD